MRATLQRADSIVIVSGGSVDEARLASETLTWLEANGYGELVRNAVVAINSATQGTQPRQGRRDRGALPVARARDRAHPVRPAARRRFRRALERTAAPSPSTPRASSPPSWWKACPPTAGTDRSAIAGTSHSPVRRPRPEDRLRPRRTDRRSACAHSSTDLVDSVQAARAAPGVAASQIGVEPARVQLQRRRRGRLHPEPRDRRGLGRAGARSTRAASRCPASGTRRRGYPFARVTRHRPRRQRDRALGQRAHGAGAAARDRPPRRACSTSTGSRRTSAARR